MKCLILSLLIGFSGGVFAVEIPTEPTQIQPTNPSAKPTEVDMNQFKNLPAADKRSKIHADVICQMPDGSSLKLGDAGYKECMELKANRVMNQPHSPEAAPYDPRTK
jgi:hypothetical protein